MEEERDRSAVIMDPQGVTHRNCYRRMILIPKILRFLHTPRGKLFPIRQQSRGGHPDVLVDGLYSAIRAFD
jgi:hypothetical protein